MTDPSLDALQARVERAGKFAVLRDGDALVLHRKRALPSRGLFRLLIPRVVVRLTLTPALEVSVRPDVWAWVMLVVCAGGTVVELTMDRIRYPRDYPPQFVLGLSAYFMVSLVLEAFRAFSLAQRTRSEP